MSVRKTLTLFAVGTSMAMAAMAAACDTCSKNMVVGSARVLGNGLVWSWAKLDDKGNPTSIGISMTESAMTGLPELKDMPKDGEPMMEYILDLPSQVKGKPFDHIAFDWNPIGHPPMKLYDVPHFDIHFYMISQEQRSKITATGADLPIAGKKPEPKFMPAGYILPPDTLVPTMGAHWIDLAAPELKGMPFSTTFLYGTYNGEAAFWEPMVATSFLQTKPNYTENIKVPSAYAKPGYYPTRYTVQYNADRHEYTIALAGMTAQGGVELLAQK